MTRLGSVVAAAALAVATTVLPGVTLAPATAGACSDAGGVTVAVDPGSLSGSLSQTCVGGGGSSAAALFGDAGQSLTRVQRFPGAVCKVNGEPTSSSCVNMPPTNAYWALFWSDGTSGSWAYSSAGVDNLKVPAGGSVALAWQSSNSRRNPAVKPPDHDGSEAEDPGGSGGSGGGKTGGGSGGSAGGGSSDAPQSAPPSASESPTSDAPSPGGDEQTGKRDRDREDGAKRDRPSEQKSQSAEPTDGATVSPDAVTEDEVATTSQPVTEGGLPLWLVGLAAACLLAAGAVVAVVRRNTARGA